jgi:hypothetical protein
MPKNKSESRTSSNGRTSDEYDRMEHLMRGLLKVPKKAIREAEEREKKSR